jgi:hypothetical protein
MMHQILTSLCTLMQILSVCPRHKMHHRLKLFARRWCILCREQTEKFCIKVNNPAHLRLYLHGKFLRNGTGCQELRSGFSGASPFEPAQPSHAASSQKGRSQNGRSQNGRSQNGRELTIIEFGGTGIGFFLLAAFFTAFFGSGLSGT